jgi:hypothetical protein
MIQNEVLISICQWWLLISLVTFLLNIYVEKHEVGTYRRGKVSDIRDWKLIIVFAIIPFGLICFGAFIGPKIWDQLIKDRELPKLKGYEWTIFVGICAIISWCKVYTYF